MNADSNLSIFGPVDSEMMVFNLIKLTIVKKGFTFIYYILINFHSV